MLKKSLQILLCVFLLTSAESIAQKKDKKNKKGQAPVAAAPADVKKPDGKKEPKPYKKVIDSTAVTQKGLIDVHKVADKYLFEISESLIGKEIMTITRYSKTPAGGGIFGGEEINRQVVRFEKGMNNTIILRSITYVITTPDEDKPITKSVKNSSADPIIGIYDVLAYKKSESGKENVSSVIDMTTAFDSDTQTFLFKSDKQTIVKHSSVSKRQIVYSICKKFPYQYRNQNY